MEFENTGAEVQEVAEPATESVETQEVAEPATEPDEQTGKTSADAAFAAQRREIEAANQRAADAERKLAEMEAASNARSAALKKLTGREDADISALADSIGVSAEDIMATMAAERESAQKDVLIAQLQDEITSITVDATMQRDLATIQQIDPNIKDLNDLGEPFVNYIRAGLTAEDAYYAVKAREINTRATPPEVIGKVDSKPPEKDYFTEAEVDAMTPSQQRANADRILASMGKW